MKPRSSVPTIVAVAACAYSACDLIHEVLGHGTAAWLSPEVSALSLSTVALQTSGSSRAVAAAGTIANLVVGILALALARGMRGFGASRWFLILLGAVDLLNATAYPIFSAALGIGDWAVVIAGLQPPLGWRIGLGVVGVVSYALAIRAIARALEPPVLDGTLEASEVPRLVVPTYVAGGLLLVVAAAMNPIDPSLILTSGASTGFGAMAGLLMVPGIVRRRLDSSRAPDATLSTGGALEASTTWIVAGVLCAAVFVGVIGRGIHR